MRVVRGRCERLASPSSHPLRSGVPGVDGLAGDPVAVGTVNSRSTLSRPPLLAIGRRSTRSSGGAVNHQPGEYSEAKRHVARDLPETALRAASRRLATRSSAATLTCVNVWRRKVLQRVANYRRIDGKDAVRQSALPPATAGKAASVGRPLVVRTRPAQGSW
jgi:hypothetical protein